LTLVTLVDLWRRQRVGGTEKDVSGGQCRGRRGRWERFRSSFLCAREERSAARALWGPRRRQFSTRAQAKPVRGTFLACASTDDVKGA